MITVVIGHRGTGKTELMKRLQLYVSEGSVELLDLDTEIEKKIGKTIPELFLEHGETYFRELERQLFLEILQTKHPELYLVLGAGFDLSVVPDSVRILWVKRATDLDGRIFLNRPRLNPELSPIEEFRKRAQSRELSYREKADEVYVMPEGIFDNRHQAMAKEKMILTHTLASVEGVITILPEIFSSDKRWDLFKARFHNRGVQFFELRDDFLSPEQMRRALREMPEGKFIYSFRAKTENVWSELADILQQVSKVDWAWELGAADEVLNHVAKEKLILSLHEAGQFQEWLAAEDRVGHMKYAPEVHTFNELWQGHEWQSKKSQARSFLPRSQSGRWQWYRRLQKGRQLLNFWREDGGSAGDQPTLWMWLMTPGNAPKFAAVLGAPVIHSYTPLEHSDFFQKRNIPVVAVDIQRTEWDEALPVLRKLGLAYAAVTSPHKENAARLCESQDLKALNTLYWNDFQKKWQGTSTDDQGFLELIEGIGMIAPLQKEIVVWGGGGTLGMIQKALPHARYFSSRTAGPRSTDDGAEAPPKIVIWAAPRAADTVMPPLEWQPAMVFDLNYKEDSLGREYAQKCGANYQSGLVMFTSQAQGQRLFWKNCEETP